MEPEIRIGVLKVTKQTRELWHVSEKHDAMVYSLGRIEYTGGSWFFMPDPAVAHAIGLNQTAMVYIAAAMRVIEVG